MESHSELQEALTEVQTKYPFNNVRRLIKHVDPSRRMPQAFGGACVFHLKKLKERLEGNERYDLSFIEETGAYHTAALVEDRELKADFLLDPYLLHKEPINLTELFKTRGKRSFPVHPKFRSQAQARLEVMPMFPSVMITAYYNPFDERDYTAHVFNTGSRLAKHPPIIEKRLKSEVPELALRILDLEEGVTTLAADIHTGTLQIRKKGSRTARLSEHSENFATELAQVSARVHIEVAELLKLFTDARRIYHELRRPPLK